ncbi:MAG: hypothetical protein JWP74_2062 [Marmoricola sp.]|nr:hypothetical protein [Marmoricola sp.]
MTFSDELKQLQEEVATDTVRDNDRKTKESPLIIEAGSWLREAADELARRNVPLTDVCSAHKVRISWTWPARRTRTSGWILKCGEADLLLRPDGWLAALHRCSDPNATLCACRFSRSKGPVPPGVYLPLSDTGEVPDGEQQLMVRTQVEGELTNLPFARWLAEQVVILTYKAELARRR